MDDFQLLSVTEVSKLLKVNRNYIYDLIKYGHISAMKLGSLKILSTEVQRFITENQGKDFTDLKKVKDMAAKDEKNNLLSILSPLPPA